MTIELQSTAIAQTAQEAPLSQPKVPAKKYALKPFEDVLAFTQFTDGDTANLQKLIPVIEPELMDISHRFYEAIQRVPLAAGVFEDEAQIDRLKVSLRAWILDVLNGPHDANYYFRHLRIGHRHVEVGLPMRFMFTAMNQLRSDLSSICYREFPPQQCTQYQHSLMKVLDIELAVMLESYVEDTTKLELEDLRNLLMHHLPITALLLDRDGMVTTATTFVGQHLFQCQPHQVTGRPYQTVLHQQLMLDTNLEKHVASASETGNEIVMPRVDVLIGQSARSLRLTVVPLDHPQARMLVHIEDLTDVIESESRAKHAESLAHLGRMSAAIAHEIRNPLAGLSGTMQVLMSSLPESDRRHMVMGKVLEQIQRLDGLVTDLLQFARPVTASCQNVDLKALGRRVASQLTMGGMTGTRVRGKGFAYTDSALLHQVLHNLALNAFQAGSKKVEFQIEDALIAVVDDGPGVPDNKREEIFKPFVTTRVRGTGLGLPNCVRFVEAMGGRLTLSQPDEGGTCFTVKLLTGKSASSRTSPSDNAERIE